MAALVRRLDRHWDWQLSAHCRVASLGSAWALVLAMPLLGWLALPLTVGRSLASFVQTGLNVRLGRQTPVARQDRWDWVLIAAIFGLAYTALGISHLTGLSPYSPVLVLPMLLPFSALQLRMVRRSHLAHREHAARPVAIERLARFERGQLRVLADFREVDRAA